jgi:hypothetical protein
MKTINIIFIVGLLFTVLPASGQEKGVREEGAHEAEFNAGGQDMDPGSNKDSGDLDSDADAQSNDPDQAANTSGTDTRTTSSAGSPGILMENDEVADGTNTMQRASLNIAGSPLPSQQSSKTRESGDRSEYRTSDGKLQKKVIGGQPDHKEKESPR